MRTEEIEEDYMQEFEEERKEDYEEFEEERENDRRKDHRCHIPSMKINCDLEVTIGSKNKVIYVCPGKLQYFTASAICCCSGGEIEIEYCGRNAKCICGEVVISGCLGFYKIVKSGIIFIPRHKLSLFRDDWFPTDILCFKAKEKHDGVDREVKFDVVFTSSRCITCERHCNKNCKG